MIKLKVGAPIKMLWNYAAKLYMKCELVYIQANITDFRFEFMKYSGNMPRQTHSTSLSLFFYPAYTVSAKQEKTKKKSGFSDPRLNWVRTAQNEYTSLPRPPRALQSLYKI